MRSSAGRPPPLLLLGQLFGSVIGPGGLESEFACVFGMLVCAHAMVLKIWRECAESTVGNPGAIPNQRPAEGQGPNARSPDTKPWFEAWASPMQALAQSAVQGATPGPKSDAARPWGQGLGKSGPSSDLGPGSIWRKS